MRYSKIIGGGIVCAACLTGGVAAAQDPSLVGTWRGQMTMVAAGGDNMVIDSQDIFMANGTFSAETTSHYGTGPNAGKQIGNISGSGTYTVDPTAGTISFHVNNFISSDPTLKAPPDETDHYAFTSPTTLTVQAHADSQTATFQKVQ